MSNAEFTKRATGSNLGQPLYEAAGLAWLASGGAPTAKVIAATPTQLRTELLAHGSPSATSARELGRDLARLHASGAPWFGAPPANYDGPGWMGAAPLSFTTEPQPWGRFYAEQRIRPYLSNVFTAAEAEVIETLCARLEDGSLNHPQPALVQDQGVGAARIHGDLWSGNVMWTPRGGVLIDPAAQGGHAEEDLATLHTFGAPFLEEIIAGYQEVSPLAAGWRDRVGLHQMHILMVHSHLFGRSYVPRTIAVAKDALRLAGTPL